MIAITIELSSSSSSSSSNHQHPRHRTSPQRRPRSGMEIPGCSASSRPRWSNARSILLLLFLLLIIIIVIIICNYAIDNPGLLALRQPLPTPMKGAPVCVCVRVCVCVCACVCVRVCVPPAAPPAEDSATGSGGEGHPSGKFKTKQTASNSIASSNSIAIL